MLNQEENLYPNAGQHFSQVPEDQNKEVNTQADEVLSAVPALNKVIERWEKRAAFYSSIDSIDVDLADDPDLHQKKMVVAGMMKEELQKEIEGMKALIASFTTE